MLVGRAGVPGRASGAMYAGGGGGGGGGRGLGGVGGGGGRGGGGGGLHTHHLMCKHQKVEQQLRRVGNKTFERKTLSITESDPARAHPPGGWRQRRRLGPIVVEHHVRNSGARVHGSQPV